MQALTIRMAVRPSQRVIAVDVFVAQEGARR